MITHFKRVRTDFEEAQARCLKRRDRYAPRAERFRPCRLPEECEMCEHWVCNACEEVVPWSNGSDGDGGMLCDTCWCKFISFWQDAQDEIERMQMQKYDQACAL